MNLLPRWTWLRALRRGDDDGRDPADMGTAFGLDASLDVAPEPAAPRPLPTGAAPGRSARTGLPLG